MIRKQAYRPTVSGGLEAARARVHGGAANAQLEVEVRAGGTARGADAADQIPRHHAAAARDGDAAEVRVPARHPEPVTDDHDASVALDPAHRLHAAAAGRADRGAERRRIVLTRVEHRTARPEAIG